MGCRWGAGGVPVGGRGTKLHAASVALTSGYPPPELGLRVRIQPIALWCVVWGIRFGARHQLAFNVATRLAALGSGCLR